MEKIDINLLKTGDAILTHSFGFKPIAYGIRKLTHSYFNHVAFVVNCEVEDPYVIEAQPKAVLKTPLSFYTKGNYDLKVVRVKADSFKDQQEYDNAIKLSTSRMLGLIGRKYDFTAIVFLSLKYLFKGLFSNTNKFQKRERFFCSESFCYAFSGSSSKVKNLFAGKKNPEAKCGVITPRDISKSANTEYICGVEKD